MQNLTDLFEHTLRDIYYAEKKITKALPKMARKATSQDLADAFRTHLQETEGQIRRLEAVFELVGKKPKAKKCEAIDGLVEEAEDLMKKAEDDTVRDAAMLAAAQAVEHYEISRYGTLKAWATKLGFTEAAKLLDATLQEEIATDKKLGELAASEINIKAAAAADNDDDDPNADAHDGDDDNRADAEMRAKSVPRIKAKRGRNR